MLGNGTSIGTQLASQHRSRTCRLHKHDQKYPTKEEATTHPPDGIMVSDWVVLYEKVRKRIFLVLRSTPIALLALAISRPKLGLLIATANRAIGLLLKHVSKVGCLGLFLLLNSRGALAKLKEDLRMFDEVIDKGNNPVEMVHKRLETLNKIQQ
nr:hypothetical protein [Tanacetum cinerariifolium]